MGNTGANGREQENKRWEVGEPRVRSRRTKGGKYQGLEAGEQTWVGSRKTKCEKDENQECELGELRMGRTRTNRGKYKNQR